MMDLTQRDNLARSAAQDGSERLHRATVAMYIRNGITLPGMSAAHTIAIARNLGLIARAA